MSANFLRPVENFWTPRGLFGDALPSLGKRLAALGKVLCRLMESCTLLYPDHREAVGYGSKCTIQEDDPQHHPIQKGLDILE
jgi:hypothetical protein